jgi:hypothetical protein
MDWTTFVWMFVMLKIPIAMLLWLVWYAIQTPEPETADDQDDGGSDRRHGKLPRHPGPPRRGGPHASPLPAPPRVRTAARSRDTTRD